MQTLTETIQNTEKQQVKQKKSLDTFNSEQHLYRI